MVASPAGCVTIDSARLRRRKTVGSRLGTIGHVWDQKGTKGQNWDDLGRIGKFWAELVRIGKNYIPFSGLRRA
jgi:hypothetical protein